MPTGEVTQMCDCKRDRFWVRYPLKEIKYLIFLFSRSGNSTRRGVEFCHLRHIARFRRKVEKEGVLIENGVP